MVAEEALGRVEGAHGRAVAKVVANHVAPIVFAPEARADREAVNNGTIFFLDCGEGAFALTADHVYRAYLRRKQQDPTLLCRIDGMRFDPRVRLIDRDPEKDIATFRVEEGEIARLGKAVYRPPARSWPPKPPEPGESVLVVGFPAHGRRLVRSQGFAFGIYVATALATSINSREVVCQFQRENRSDPLGIGASLTNEALGGLSGAPLWTLGGNDGFFGWRLAGVISSFNEGWELLKAKHAAYILRDGTLRSDLLDRVLLL